MGPFCRHSRKLVMVRCLRWNSESVQGPQLGYLKPLYAEAGADNHVRPRIALLSLLFIFYPCRMWPVARHDQHPAMVTRVCTSANLCHQHTDWADIPSACRWFGHHTGDSCRRIPFASDIPPGSQSLFHHTLCDTTMAAVVHSIFANGLSVARMMSAHICLHHTDVPAAVLHSSGAVKFVAQLGRLECYFPYPSTETTFKTRSIRGQSWIRVTLI